MPLRLFTVVAHFLPLLVLFLTEYFLQFALECDLIIQALVHGVKIRPLPAHSRGIRAITPLVEKFAFSSNPSFEEFPDPALLALAQVERQGKLFALQGGDLFAGQFWRIRMCVVGVGDRAGH